MILVVMFQCAALVFLGIYSLVKGIQMGDWFNIKVGIFFFIVCEFIVGSLVIFIVIPWIKELGE